MDVVAGPDNRQTFGFAANTCLSMRQRFWFRYEDSRVDPCTLPVCVPGMSQTRITPMIEALFLPQDKRKTV